MNDTFNWLHLSDLHFGLAGQSSYLGEIKARFLDDLVELHKTSGPWHAVFFTGDLVQSGEAAQFSGLKAAFMDAFWARLRELGSGNAAFYAVPGNHDLQRPILKSHGSAPGKPRPPATALMLTSQFDSVSEDFWASDAGEYHELLATAFKDYAAWWAAAPGRPPDLAHPAGLLPGDFAHTQEVAGRRIGILGLNSTALQLTGDNFMGKLAVHPAQAARLVGDLPEWVAGHHACILLTHQGPAWLSETAQQDYAEINPAGRFAVHLFGHEHASVFSGQSWGGGQTRLVAQGHSLFSKEPIQHPQAEERRHGYAAGRITFEGGRGTIRFWPRKAWKDKVNGWRFGRDLESVAKLEERDGGTPPSPITVSVLPLPEQDESRPSLQDPKAARIAEIYQKVLHQLKEALEKNPAMVAYLFNTFEAGKVEEKENAASWLTLYIVENFERALKAVLGKPDSGPGGTWSGFSVSCCL